MGSRHSLTPLVLVTTSVLWFGAGPAQAGETNGYVGPRWAFLDVKEVARAAAEITQEKYPDCDEATVEKKMVRVYRADGTGECQDESFEKGLTEKGNGNN